MGQRSQIYIKIKDNYNKTPKLYAKYFSWNFGERMISRARYGIEYIKRNEKKLESASTQEKINRIFDVNFDMKDITITSDLITEWIEQFADDFKANSYIFCHGENNDGRLFIDVNENAEIKFCFTDSELNILTPEEYMNWDYPTWRNSKFLSKENLQICENNIKFINQNAKLMTKEELQEFINFDYSKQINEVARQLGIEIKLEQLRKDIILEVDKDSEDNSYNSIKWNDELEIN